MNGKVKCVWPQNVWSVNLESPQNTCYDNNDLSVMTVYFVCVGGEVFFEEQL